MRVECWHTDSTWLPIKLFHNPKAWELHNDAISCVNLQGVLVSGYPMVAVEPAGDGGLVCTGWSPVEAVQVFCWPLAPDPLFGGQVNTVQEIITYGVGRDFPMSEFELPLLELSKPMVAGPEPVDPAGWDTFNEHLAAA